MDESAFRQARAAANPQPCAFEKALLVHCCACSLAQRRNIAEREAVSCRSSGAQEQCAALRALLRQKSAFALKLTQVHGPLSHAKEMKVECGGLQGLQVAITAGDAAPDAPASGAGAIPLIEDVHDLVQVCVERFGGLTTLPYSAIVQSVVAFQIRRRRPRQ